MGDDYPSETFRVENKEMNEFGEYRTQRLVLEASGIKLGSGALLMLTHLKFENLKSGAVFSHCAWHR